MRVSQPKPFFFKKGPRAVILLHGFTGNSADVRMLGRFLETNGYTSIAPHFAGHGVAPEELVGTGPTDWWKDVEQAYDTLIEEGYSEIAVAGLSLGGVFSLKLGYTKPIKGIVSMCAPMNMKSTDLMYQGVLKYARDYKNYEGKSDELIEKEIEAFQEKPMESLADLRDLVADVKEHVDHIYAPLFVVQGRLDTVIDTDSANVIYDNSESTDKHIKWYENSGHVITLDKEKKKLHEDIFTFLESLDWSV
ncbi:alpha/beta hydrolase [Planococcus halocryophilus]|uniref:Carboxylesterase n=1 Tax=Planococcus halocryophilus TaxID=1215089 RepID=A0A1C7DM84_9BACL|nr:carboxylesterase [Planococcus halocryophilus]ANU12537.1 carboxylesterase [Planococcus halocryophilus]